MEKILEIDVQVFEHHNQALLVRICSVLDVLHAVYGFDRGRRNDGIHA